MTAASSSLDEQCINTIRFLAVDAVQRANSGHPGLPLGAAPMAYTLWQKHMRHNPHDPRWPDRDRFVLSAGHGSMLQYALLHLTGYDVPMSELQSFRQWGSRTPGHPESFVTPGVEATTGPLGQGSANAVGFALAERFLANQFNRPGHNIVDHNTYAIVSDGDLMEGLSAEASSLAGHLKLGKLIYLYDANEITLDGPASLAFSEDVGKRYESYGWQVLKVADGNKDVAGLDRAIKDAKADTTRPSIIIVRTTIGYGSPNKQNSAAAHGSPLGEEEVRLTKQALGWNPDDKFAVQPGVLEHMRGAVAHGKAAQDSWNERFAAYKREHPALATAWEQSQRGELPADWQSALPTFKVGDKAATRESSGQVLNALAERIPWLFGGDADLSVSTLTSIKGGKSFNGQTGEGRNIHFGVREHAMAAVVNGMAYHGGVHPYCSTFFVFSDYMRPSVRLASLCKLPVTYVWTHDSVGLGEDGPTHQPIEHLAALRAMPNMTVIRPADAVETAEAWRLALQHRSGPVGLVLSRQKLAVIDRPALGSANPDVGRGAYVISDPPGGSPQAIIIATGSEVHIAIAASKLLAESGVRARVVSMPSWELFRAQGPVYHERVLPSAVTARLAIEAGVTMGWERWVGDHGTVLGLDHFGASAPGEVLYEKFGLTPQHAADLVQKLLATV